MIFQVYNHKTNLTSFARHVCGHNIFTPRLSLNSFYFFAVTIGHYATVAWIKDSSTGVVAERRNDLAGLPVAF